MSTLANIVVVEDESLSREMLVRRLTDRSFNAIGVPTARQAIDHLDRHQVDLILMDNDLPDVSGVEAVRVLRRNWSHDSLPIIMVSAMIDSDDVVEALLAGANDYVVKPVNIQVLVARIRTALRMKENVAALVEAERQRVMITALGNAAASIGEPMLKMIDQLEHLLHNPPTEPATIRDALHELLDQTSRAVDIIDQLRQISQLQGVPYTARMDILNDLGTQ